MLKGLNGTWNHQPWPTLGQYVLAGLILLHLVWGSMFIGMSKYTISGNVMWPSPLHCFECNLTKKMLIFMTFSEMQVFPYFKMHTWPWRQHSKIITTSDHYYYFFLTFFLLYCDFSFSIASLSILGNVHRPYKQ